MWERIIRTRNVPQDQWMLEQARAEVESKGLVLQVVPLAGGGLQVLVAGGWGVFSLLFMNWIAIFPT